MGEAIVSLKQLLGRFAFTDSVYATIGSWQKLDTSSFGSGPLTALMELFSLQFRFWRGSRRYKLFMLDSGHRADGTILRGHFVQTWMKLSSQALFHGVAAAAPGEVAGGSAEHITFCDLNPVHEITVPFYRSSLVEVVGSTLGSPLRPIVYFTMGYTDPLPTDSPPLYAIYSAAGDDFTFGYQIAFRSGTYGTR